jgi:hypothetical protein
LDSANQKLSMYLIYIANVPYDYSSIGWIAVHSIVYYLILNLKLLITLIILKLYIKIESAQKENNKFNKYLMP